MGSQTSSDTSDEYYLPFQEHDPHSTLWRCPLYITSQEPLDYISIDCILFSGQQEVLVFNKYNSTFTSDDSHFLYQITLPTSVKKVTSVSGSCPLRLFHKLRDEQIFSKSMSMSKSSRNNGQGLFVHSSDMKFSDCKEIVGKYLDEVHIFTDESPQLFHIMIDEKKKTSFPAILFLKNDNYYDYHRKNKKVSKYTYCFPISCHVNHAPQVKCFHNPQSLHSILYYYAY